MVTAAWLDLSQGIDERMPHPATFPRPQIVRISELEGETPQVTQFTLCTHMGTHVDAPSHFVEGGRSITDYPPERFILEGVVWSVGHGELEIDRASFEAALPQPEKGDAVLLSTTWEDKWTTGSYLDHPYVSDSASDWLLQMGVSMLGVDTLSPDRPVIARPPGFNFPVHRSLLGHDVLIIENLRGLRPLIGHRVEIFALPIQLLGADGAPSRVIARRLD